MHRSLFSTKQVYIISATKDKRKITAKKRIYRVLKNREICDEQGIDFVWVIWQNLCRALFAKYKAWER